MQAVSVIIITKNEAFNIVDCIAAAKRISADVIVIDSGSIDDTILLAKKEGVSVHTLEWQGYGHARNYGAALAKNNWIFSLDADERITNSFAKIMANLSLADEHIIYGFKRINYFGNKKMRYGSFAHDRVFRLYNRLSSRWNLVPVHEKLIGNHITRTIVNASFIHVTATVEADYLNKITGYASLCALKYQQEGKQFVFGRILVSPVFNFIKDYIVQLGFLDGYQGFLIAKLNAVYTRKKYQQLKCLLKPVKKLLQQQVLQSSS